MKKSIKQLLIISLLCTVISPLAFAMEGTTEQPNKSENWDSWATNDMMELASLIYEQTYSVGILDSILNEQHQQYNSQVCQVARDLGNHVTKFLEELKNDGLPSDSISEKRNLLAVKTFAGLNHLILRYNKFNFDEKLIPVLDKYHDDRFQALRHIIEIIKKHKTELLKEKSIGFEQLLTMFAQLASDSIQDIIKEHAKYPHLRDEIRTMLNTVQLRQHTMEEIANLRNTFTDEQFFSVFDLSGPEGASHTPSQQHPFNIEELKNWPTDCLLRILTLMEQQAYWMKLLSAVLQNVANEPISEAMKSDLINLQNAVNDMIKVGDVDAINESPADQKRRGLELFACLWYISEHKAHVYKAFTYFLREHPTIDLFDPALALITLTTQEKYTIKSCVQNYDTWRSKILAIIGQHNKINKRFIETAAAVRTELFNRANSTNANMLFKNPLFQFKITEDQTGTPELQISTADSLIHDEATVITKTIKLREMPSENKQLPDRQVDLAKMPPTHLNELASLLHEQAKCVALFDADFKESPELQADQEVTQLHNAINQTTENAMLALDKVDPAPSTTRKAAIKEISFVYNTFCACFAMHGSSQLLATYLAKYPVAELAPLRKLVGYFDLLSALLGKMELGTDISYDIKSTKEQFTAVNAAIKRIVREHDSLFSRIEKLYTDTLNQLKGRKSAGVKMRSSIFFPKNVMPIHYSLRHPEIIELPAPQQTIPEPLIHYSPYDLQALVNSWKTPPQ